MIAVTVQDAALVEMPAIGLTGSQRDAAKVQLLGSVPWLSFSPLTEAPIFAGAFFLCRSRRSCVFDWVNLRQSKWNKSGRHRSATRLKGSHRFGTVISGEVATMLTVMLIIGAALALTYLTSRSLLQHVLDQEAAARDETVGDSAGEANAGAQPQTKLSMYHTQRRFSMLVHY